MHSRALLLLPALLLAAPAHAGWPREVKPLRLEAGRTTGELGDVARGKKVNLRFASDSAVACWPAPRNKHFDGNHVFYSVKIPARSELTITATPRDSKTDVSLYAYSIGTTRFDTPPKVPGVVSCEASFASKSIKEPFNPGKPETVRLVATTNPYNALIAVAGAKGATKGRYKLELELKTAKAAPKGTIGSAKKLKAKPGATIKTTGRIDGGSQIALKWAARSDVACWPTIRDEHFDGKHVLYEVDLPPRSEMFIKLIPKNPKLDLSLYAYSVGTKTKALPPKVNGAVSCEASYGTKSRARPYNPGKPEEVRLNAIKNPYKVYIGVAGAKGTTKGAFELQVKLSAGAKAQPKGKVKKATRIKLKPNGTVKKTGKLDGGPQIALSWASESDIACWPSIRDQHFNGAHQVYVTDLPPKSEMFIKLIPKNPKLDLSLYAYSVGTKTKALPPKVISTVSCEASFGTKSRSKPYNPGKPENVRLNAIRNPYRVYIGVAGAQGVKKGAYELQIELKTAAAAPTGKVKKATPIKTKANGTVNVKGKIDGGPQIALSWAARSDVACWPTTRNQHFDGAHALFATEIPPHSEMFIKLIPKNPKLDLSLYAYSVGTSSHNLPPKVNRAVSCEASYGSKSMAKPYNPGKPEKVRLNAIRNPYNVFIGVAGAQKVMKGSFTLEVELKTKAAEPTGKVKKATAIKVARGKSKTVKGKIDGGTQIALKWAANSSVACWPANYNDHFNGKHVVYVADLPAQSEMVVTATPKGGSNDISLYAYSVGTSSKALPPSVPSAVSCEASYGTNKISLRFNPGKPESVKLMAIRNPYRVYIGVAGAQKSKKGAFDLKVEVKPRR